MFLTAIFLKAGFLTGTAGLAMELMAFEVSLAFRTPLVELGVPFGVPFVGALVKKLAMVRCFVGPELELELCFFSDGGCFAGVATPSSLTLAILTDARSIQASNTRGKGGGCQVNWW